MPGTAFRYRANYGTVVFVSDGENYEYSNGYEDYVGSDRGAMICDDDGTLTKVGDADEQLVFMGRE